MKLDFLPLDRLHRSRSNMRFSKKLPDVTDILPSIRKHGILVPVIVRAEPGEDGFGIVAGDRRFVAATLAAAEARAAGNDPEPVPAAIMDPGDDAAALEISMLENFARLDPDEVTRWESFVRLIKEGRSVEDVGTTFGLPELAVRRILALGNLLPRIRNLYRRDEIDATTVRHLTLASKSQQRAWLALIDDPDAYAPTGHQLKAWLFGGTTIPVAHALFDVADYPGQIIADLFGDGGYFADKDDFWAAQNAVIDTRRTAYLDAGWADVVLIPPGDHFEMWKYERAAKRKGGRVYIDVRANGEVSFYVGYVSGQEARRLAKSGDPSEGERPDRPEVSGPLQTYIDLHRHAAVRARLLDFPGVALRLLLAHVLAGSPLWTIRIEPQTARNEATRESVEVATAETQFDTRRRDAIARLGLEPDTPTLVGSGQDGLTALFLTLLPMSDEAIMDLIAIAMGETLASGGSVIDAVGGEIGVDMSHYWRADDAFFDLLRDREVLGRIVAEVAGETVATANAKEAGKTLKTIVRDRLDGTNGREPLTGWVPRWMRFAPSAYTERGGVHSVDARLSAEAARNLSRSPEHPDPDEPAEDQQLAA